MIYIAFSRIILLAGFILATSVAQAGDIAPLLEPTSFQFSGSYDQTAILRIFNNEQYETTWSAAPYEWTQDTLGKDTLRSTEKLSIVPDRFQLRPHTGLEARITYRGDPAIAQEHTFRIVLTSSAMTKEGIDVSFSHSMPAFVPPPHALAQHVVELASPAINNISVKVANHGNIHDYLKDLTVEGIDANQNSVFKISRPGWYILANSNANYSIKLASEDCKVVKGIRTTAQFRSGIVTNTEAVFAGQCTLNSKEKTQFEILESQTSAISADQRR